MQFPGSNNKPVVRPLAHCSKRQSLAYALYLMLLLHSLPPFQQRLLPPLPPSMCFIFRKQTVHPPAPCPPPHTHAHAQIQCRTLLGGPRWQSHSCHLAAGTHPSTHSAHADRCCCAAAHQRRASTPSQSPPPSPTDAMPHTAGWITLAVNLLPSCSRHPCVACCVSPLHPWTPRLVAAPDHVFALPTSFKVISHPCGTLPRPAPAPSLKWLLQLQSSSSWKTTGATAASTMCFRLLKSIISCDANGHSRA